MPTKEENRKKIEALAYRFWSIHPKELDELDYTVPKYKNPRAAFYADEMEKLFESFQNAD